MPSKYFRGADFNDDGTLKAAKQIQYTTPYASSPVDYRNVYAAVPKYPWASWHPQPDPKPVVGYKANELDKMPEDHFEDLKRRVTAELARREEERTKTKEKRQGLHNGLSNFLLGVAHAMACRAALRWVKGLRPYSPDGKGSGHTPTSGEMWNIYDVAELGQELLTGNPNNRVTNKDGNTYLVNSNPVAWKNIDALKVWLRQSHLVHYNKGTAFCAYRTGDPPNNKAIIHVANTV